MFEPQNWTELTPKIEKHIEDNVQPILSKYDAKIKDRNFNDKDYIRNIITIEVDGETIPVTRTSFERTKYLEWFLKNLKDIRNIARQFVDSGFLYPFHSDIYRTFKLKYRTTENIEMGYSYVCNAIVQAGGKVTTDN